MTKIAWVTPGYPPERGGISDHSAAMVDELRAQGNEVLVLSKPHDAGFDRVSAELETYCPKAMVVAYAPLGYAAKTGGISPGFVRWCRGFQGELGAKTLLLAHEASLPVAYHWQRHELKLALLASAQVAQFEVLARSFDRVAFSNEGMREIWANRIPRMSHRMTTVRICSNIPRVATLAPTAELLKAGYSVAPKTVMFFGSGHPSVLFDYVEAAFARLLALDPEVQLIIVGMDARKLHSLCPSLVRFGRNVQTLGFVPARDVSLWLQVAELVLAPLVEGVNARKGTIMAAMQHGRPVVTTRGFHTRDDIPWDQLCALSSIDREVYAELSARCFLDSSWRERLGQAARADYEKNASASVSAARLLSLALGADTG